MGCACRAHGGNENCAQHFIWKTWTEDLGVDGWVVSKWILRKQGVDWIHLAKDRDSCAGSCIDSDVPSGSIKKVEVIYSIDERLSSSQYGRRSIGIFRESAVSKKMSLFVRSFPKCGRRTHCLSIWCEFLLLPSRLTPSPRYTLFFLCLLILKPATLKFWEGLSAFREQNVVVWSAVRYENWKLWASYLTVRYFLFATVLPEELCT